jgi:winged helix DNA-binding protein
VPRALERIAGIQAQYAPSMYVGLWSRVEGLRRDQVTRALEGRTIVQATLMRATIHLVSARDYWPFEVAIRDRRREAWQRVAQPDAAMSKAAALLDRRLADGPLRAAEIEELLGKDRARRVGMWLDLVRVPPSGTWERRRADLYAAAGRWLGPAEVGPVEACEQLVRRYLGGFGPSSPGEIADWAGLPLGDVADVLGRLRLRRFAAEDGEELVDLPRAPLPGPDTPAPVRFLPVWDATLLVHARRTGILPEQHRARVFDPKTPHAVPTFLVDGAVAGTWRYEQGRVEIEPFGRLDRSKRRALEDEAERLAEFHA